MLPINILKAMTELRTSGCKISPRGQDTLELRNYQFTVDNPFSSFKARKFNLSYLKQEFLWYLSGDPYNTIILRASDNWSKFRQPTGHWFSNYGQYWFGPHINPAVGAGYISGVDWVVSQLRKDPDSRQAIIPMLSTNHLFDGNVDVVCTVYVNFHVRDGKLHMTVRMRSSDIIWGYGNDLPCFWWLHEIVARLLGLEVGQYVHSSDSLHVYSRHFDMINKICDDALSGCYEIEYPPIDDPYDLLHGNFKSNFGRWLKDH